MTEERPCQFLGNGCVQQRKQRNHDVKARSHLDEKTKSGKVIANQNMR